MADHSQLQRARTILNMSAAEAAAAIGIGRSALTLFEGGHAENPSLAEKLTALYKSMGLEFGRHGQIGFRPGLIKGVGTSKHH